MITQRLMKTGDFELSLKPGAPNAILRQIAYFDHLVLTPTVVSAVELTDDAILQQATFVGPITDIRNARTLIGHDLAHWFATARGRGDLLSTPTGSPGSTLDQWWTILKPASIATGSVVDVGTVTKGEWYLISRREAFDAVCRDMTISTTDPVEWRINPDGTLDGNYGKSLFQYPPSTIITRRQESSEGAWRGLNGTFTHSGDVEEYVTEAIALGKGTGTSTPLASSVGTTPYVDFFGNPVVMQQFVDAPLDEDPQATADAVVRQLNQDRSEVTLSSRTYVISRTVRPGDWVYVWDLAAGLFDFNTQIQYRGETITPATRRVYATTSPVEKGQGVLIRKMVGGVAEYIDVTDWVEWETGDTRLEVGAAARAVSDQIPAGAVAYLGQNPQVAARAVSVTGSRTPFYMVDSQMQVLGSSSSLGALATYITITVPDCLVGDVINIDAQVDYDCSTADATLAAIYVNGTKTGTDTFVSVPIGRTTAPVVRRHVVTAAGNNVVTLRAQKFFSGSVQIVAQNTQMRTTTFTPPS